MYLKFVRKPPFPKKQPQTALKMAELLIRRAETKNLNSAQIWLSKAEALNRGSPELFALKMDYMKCKGVKPVEIVNFVQAQIKLNTRQLSLYTALIEQMIAGGLPADKKVGELERDVSLRHFLFQSTHWLDMVIANSLQEPNELLIKQMIVCHLKLAQQSLASGDLLKLDSMFGGCSDQQLKIEASCQFLYLLASRADVDARRRNVLLLQSLCYEQGVYRGVNSALGALVNRRKVVAHLFLRSIDFGTVRDEYGELLSSSDMQSNLVQTVLRGATHLPRLLLPVQVDALPEPKPALVELLAASGASLDTLIWSIKMLPEYQRSRTLHQFVLTIFKELAANNAGGDASGELLTQADMEAFLVSVLASTPPPAGLPVADLASQMQRDFYRAASELRSTVVSKIDHVQHRKTLRNGKNVLRLKGAEPPAEILAAIGAHFATMGDPYMAVFYLGAIEDKLKTVSHGGGLIRGDIVTLLGIASGAAMTAGEAKSMLDMLTESRGSKEEFENNYEEATRLFTLANTASSLYKAARLIVGSTNQRDQSQGTQMDEFTRANELCSQASAMQPDDELSEQLSELHIQINDALVELDSEAIKDDTAENDTFAIMNQTPQNQLNRTNNSVYGTPSDASFHRRSYFSPSSKQVGLLVD